MFPVARITDPISHDLITPCGLISYSPVGPCPGASPVLVEFLPVAHVTHVAVCTGVIAAGIVHPPPPPPVPPPPIVVGAPTTLVHFMPVARWAPSGDVAACGTFLGLSSLAAMRRVFVGMVGAGGGGLAGGMLGAALGGLWSMLNDLATAIDFALAIRGIEIEGSDAFVAQVRQDLWRIYSTPTGRKLLHAVSDSGRTTTIQQQTPGAGNATNTTTDALRKPDGTPGKGADTTILYDPDTTSIGPEPWQTRPPAIGLAHELAHSEQASRGDWTTEELPNDSKPDPADPTKTDTERRHELEAAGIPPHDSYPYNENKIRDEWSPKQPQRPYY